MNGGLGDFPHQSWVYDFLTPWWVGVFGRVIRGAFWPRMIDFYKGSQELMSMRLLTLHFSWICISQVETQIVYVLFRDIAHTWRSIYCELKE